MIIDRKARHADWHYAILPSPAFLLRESVVANPLNSFYNQKASELHLRFAVLPPDDCPKELKSLYPSKSTSTKAPEFSSELASEFSSEFVLMRTFWPTQAGECLRHLHPLP